MATKNQYEFFNARYNEELDRMRDLQKKAQLYFTITTAISSIFFLNLKDLKSFIGSEKGLYVTLPILIVILLLTIVALIQSLRVKKYNVALNPSKYMDELPDTPSYDDQDFFDNRISHFLIAIENNQTVNSDKSFYIRMSEFGMLISLFLMFMITLQIIF